MILRTTAGCPEAGRRFAGMRIRWDEKEYSMGGTFLDAARPAPGDPPVIRRLPRSVDYTHIKMMILSLPAPLTTLVWRGDPTADPLWGAFNRKSLRAIDRQLRRREAALGPA